MRDNIYRSVSEEWLERRRQEWSSYMGQTASLEIQNKFKIISGLDETIIECDENTPLQLWINIMTQRLIEIYENLELNKTTEILSILLILGFKKEMLEEHEAFRKEYECHFMLDEVIEILIDNMISKV